MGQGRLPSSIAPRLEIVATLQERSSLCPPSSSEPAWRDAAGGVVARALTCGERYWMDVPGLATFCFDQWSDRVLAAPHAGIAGDAVAEVYWHAALPLVVQARGGEALHASAVLMPRGVVALCGASGSGKSTIAYGLHRRGHPLWADDVVALEVTRSAVTAVPLPFDVRLRPTTAALFGLGARATRLAEPVEASDSAGRAPAPLEAVCVLGRGAAGSLAPRKASAAYPALLANAYCFSLEDPARKRRMLDRYLSLVARVPVMTLAVPDGLDDLAAVLDALERAFGEPARDAR